MAASRLLPVLCALLLAAPLRAQTETAPPRKEVSEAAAAGFAKLQPLLDAKNHAAALALIDQLLAAAAPAGFDAFVLHQLRAQVLLAGGRFADAIAPLERARALASANRNFFELPAHLDRLQLLARLHSQVASEAKTPAHRRAAFERSRAALRDWFAASPEPGVEMRLFAGSLAYNLAELGPTPDAALLREAASHAREALLLAVQPDPQAMLLLVACHLRLGEEDLAAELLELIVEREPANASAWAQLCSLYLGSAAGSPDSARLRALNLRALLVLERAQPLGHLLSPKDHYTRAALLFNLGRFSAAAAAFEDGLGSGKIENTRRNWELLAAAYQRLGSGERAVDALEKAVRALPADGPLEFSLAQSLHALGRVEEAYARGRSALAKFPPENRGQAALQLAFFAYELQRHDEAARWAAEARRAGGAPVSNLDQLDRAVAEALAARRAREEP